MLDGHRCKGSAYSGMIRIFIKIILQGTVFAGKQDLNKADAKTRSGAGCHSAPTAMAFLLGRKKSQAC